jgi:heptosyltransferase-1
VRILLVKTSSLGDIVHCFPAVSDVARHVRDSRIDWVVEEAFAELPTLHPAVRTVIPVALRRWRRSPAAPATWREAGAFLRQLRSAAYDRVIDAQGLLKSALITRLAIGSRHGPDAASARESLAASAYARRHRVPTALHAVERNRLLCAGALGYSATGTADYGLASPRDVREASDGSRRPVIFLSMSSRAGKLWAERDWIELGQSIARRGYPMELPWGNLAERARVLKITSAIPQARVPEQRSSLCSLAARFRESALVVGVDTGLAHLAVACGVPAIGIYADSDPERTGLYGSGAISLGRHGFPPSAGEVIDASNRVLAAHAR